MIATRLLLGGGGAFTVPVPVPYAVGTAGQFGWSDFSSQQYTAAHYNGITYIGYLKSDGNLHIISWNNASRTVIDDTDMGSLGADLHNVPSVLVRESDKRVMIFYNTHNGTDLYFRVSTNTQDVSPMGAQQTLASQIGSGHYTYPMVHQLRGEANDPLYLFFRNEAKGAFSATASQWSYSVSSDDGVTWSSKTNLYTEPGEGAYLTAWKTTETRIDVLVANKSHGNATDISMGHFYWEAAGWHKTDGTSITPPFDLADITLVHNGTGNDGATPNSVSLGPDGKPCVAFRVWSTYTGPEDLRYYWGRWNGSSWSTQQVAVNGNNAIWGNIALDPENGWRFLVGYVVGSQTEMHLMQTFNGGASFETTQLTTTSTNTQSTPVPVREAGSELTWLWGDDALDWGSGTASPIGLA